MRNICLTIAYDGTNYVGWQIQPNGVSIQSVIQQAILKLTNEPAQLITAGRTDSGVHAIGQVANFQSTTSIPCKKIQTGLQTFLPDDIVIQQVCDVPLDFHATYSAVQKRYRYLILNSRIKHPFIQRYAWRYSQPLDTAAMMTAGQKLLGTHDFRSFESHFPNKATSVRTIKELLVDRHSHWPVWSQTESLKDSPHESGELIWIEVVADGFLYNMVRAIVGTLVQVGRGYCDAEEVSRIVQSQDRSQAGETAPACGLYLVKVNYDAQWFGETGDVV